MPKHTHNNPLPLFDDVASTLADAQQQRLAEIAHERKHERPQRVPRKKHIPMPPAPARGPACVRCQNWRAPEFHDDRYGQCRMLVVTLDPAPWAQTPAGTITDRDTARFTLKVQYDHLRTGEGGKCSGFANAGEEAA